MFLCSSDLCLNHMSYDRVIPRDLFNEAKLLKCLAQLCLLIHNGKCSVLFDHNGNEFEIDQHSHDGSIYCTNILFCTAHGRHLDMSTVLNSREPFPLLLSDEDGVEIEVFNHYGELTDDFVQAIK